MSANNYQNNPNKLAPEMPEAFYDSVIELFSIPSTLYNEASMSLYICKVLDELDVGYYIDDFANIIVKKGTSETYPCFCSHLDTVHLYPKGYQLMMRKDKSTTFAYAIDNDRKSVGVGGDDKCGIFICLQLLRTLDNVKIVFFSQEESGGIGSANIDLSFFDDCCFLGGIDRWNGKDFINKYFGDYTTSKAFRKAISDTLKTRGYSCNTGLFTDCFNVQQRGLELSCFNVSCGYYSHHSNNEYVDLNELYNSYLLCKELSNITYQYKYNIPIKPKSTFRYSWDKNTYENDRWDYSSAGWSKDTDGTWRKGKLKWTQDTDGTWRKEELNKMPSTESEFYASSKLPKICEGCTTELLPSEYRFCTECYRLMRDDDILGYYRY